jgi:hypothetical protein
LHLSDDTYYVGLSKDVTERFRQHKLFYPDIIALSFKRLPHDADLLRSEERRVINQLDAANVPLLNKIHNTISYSSSSFDLLLLPQEQRQWLTTGATGATQPMGERKTIKPEKLARDKRKIAAFQRLSYCQHIVAALNKYISHTIPAWRQTEGKYWSMSCLPSTTESRMRKGTLFSWTPV